MIDFFKFLIPGYCVALLGAEALIITLVPVKVMERRRLKVLAVILCFVLVVGEILVVKHDRTVSSNEHAAEMRDVFKRFSGLHQDIVALQANMPISQEARHETKSIPTDSLKRRAVDLSDEILRFLLSREVPPGYGQGGFGEGPFGGKSADAKYDSETLEQYFSVFAPRVTEIHDEFKKRGMTDDRLETEYAHTVNNYSIRAIAERLGVLARQLHE